MNISGYFLLASALVLVFSAQQSAAQQSAIATGSECSSFESKRACDTIRFIQNLSGKNQNAIIFPNATLLVRNAFVQGVTLVARSFTIINQAITDVKQLIRTNPEDAKEVLQKAFADAKKLISDSITPFFQTLGEVLALTNNGAQKGLEAASKLLQIGGFSVLDGLNIAEYLLNHGIDNGGRATQLLLYTISLSIEAGYAGGLHYTEEAFKEVHQALINAQKRAITEVQDQVDKLNCQAITKDDDYVDTIKDINKAAEKVLSVGNNKSLVQGLIDTIICVLANVVKIATESQREVDNIIQNTRLSPLEARNKFYEEAATFKDIVHNATAQLNVLFGAIITRVGLGSVNAIEAVFLALENAKVQLVLGIEIAGRLVAIGSRYNGDAPQIFFDAAFNCLDFGKNAYLQGVVEALADLLNVL